MNLDLSKYTDFLRCISILKDLCNDIDIREGVIRQKTNDSACIFEIDLTSLIGNINIPISHLKEKLDLFKIFLGQTVSIESLDNTFKFSDLYSSLTFKNPDLDFMDNEFITPEDLNRVISMEDEDLILSTSIIGTITDRIRTVTQGFHVNSVKVSYNNDRAAITAETQATDQFATFLSDLVSEQSIVGSSNLSVTPFIIDHDGDILFQMYMNGDDKVLNRFSTTISDITINIYSRANLLTEEEETSDESEE